MFTVIYSLDSLSSGHKEERCTMCSKIFSAPPIFQSLTKWLEHQNFGNPFWVELSTCVLKHEK